ncbi:MAG TPA: MarR family transcriptional regulator [Candidatus Sulfotelmatobacter sp.]|nr:MarR family transcriptional regulator [Candidatus Sulfotelmatobacter sp.]
MARLYGLPGHLIRRCHQIVGGLFAEALSTSDLTPMQYAALTAIRAHPEIDATRLSRLIVFDKSTLGSVLERLEAKQLIWREASPRDRRAKRLRITPAGTRLIERADPIVDRVEADFLAPLPAADRTRLVRLLRRVVAGHAADEAKLT